MCDLWVHTLDYPTPPGHTSEQIKYAQLALAKTEQIKLYNSGNFFDRRAIPKSELPEIASLVQDYRTVVVENHPKINLKAAPPFSEIIEGRLEIAMGLESIHPELFAFLNKGMILNDYIEASRFLKAADIDIRSFILIGLPFLTVEENIEWTIRSLKFAFDNGASVCSVIPLRKDRGILKDLQMNYTIPEISNEMLEYVLDEGLSMSDGRCFVDLWDIEDDESDIYKRIVTKNRHQRKVVDSNS